MLNAETRAGDLTPSLQEERLARWQRILRGEMQPDVLIVPEKVEIALRAEEGRLNKLHGRPITASARKRMREDLCLRYSYPGQPVAWLETPGGKAVLAVGEDEVACLEDNVPASLRRGVVVEYVEMW